MPSSPEPSAKKTWCPTCGKLLEPDVVLCTRCGRHLATGHRGRTLVEAREGDHVAVAWIAAAAAAVGAGVAWGLLAVYAGAPLRYGACAVGLAAAAGVLLAARRRNPRLPFVAFTCTVAGLMIGKLIAVVWIVPPFALEQAQDQRRMYETLVWEMQADKRIDEKTAGTLVDDEASIDDSETGRKVKRAEAMIQERLGAMSADERRQLQLRIARAIRDRTSLLERARLLLSPWDVAWFLAAIALAGLLPRLHRR